MHDTLANEYREGSARARTSRVFPATRPRRADAARLPSRTTRRPRIGSEHRRCCATGCASGAASDLADYEALRRWSVDHVADFWQALWDYFELASPTPHAQVLADARMPGARWFDGAQLNYVDQVLRHAVGQRCRRRAGADLSQRAPAARRTQRRDRVVDARRSGGRTGGDLAAARRAARRSRRRLPAEHPARGRRLPGLRLDRRDLEPVRARTWASRRCATASARSSRRS